MNVAVFRAFRKLRISFFAVVSLIFVIFAEPSPFTLEIIACAALHEVGHIAVMLACGVEVYSVEVLPFGAEIHSGVHSSSYFVETLSALGGCIANVLTGAVAFSAYLVFGDAYTLFFAFASAFLALINLVPIRTLDGAEALHAVLSQLFGKERAEKISAVVSYFSLVTLMLFSSVVFAKLGGNLSLAFFCVYIFICAYVKS